MTEFTAKVGCSTPFCRNPRATSLPNRYNPNLAATGVSFAPNVPMRYPCSNLLRWG